MLANTKFKFKDMGSWGELHPSRVMSIYFLEYHAKLPKLMPTYIGSTMYHS